MVDIAFDNIELINKMPEARFAGKRSRTRLWEKSKFKILEVERERNGELILALVRSLIIDVRVFYIRG